MGAPNACTNDTARSSADRAERLHGISSGIQDLVRIPTTGIEWCCESGKQHNVPKHAELQFLSVGDAGFFVADIPGAELVWRRWGQDYGFADVL
jgi:hypothetical protein